MTTATGIDVAEARRRMRERMLSGAGTPHAEATTPDGILPRDPARRVPLAMEQRQLWLHAEMAPETPLYNESITIHRLGKYNHAALERALSEIVRRHAIWRTAFEYVGGELVQRIAPPQPVRLDIIDITDMPGSDRDAEARRLATEDARAPIPFDKAPLFRARVVKLSSGEHRLYLTLHHMIFDGVSIYRTLVPELAALFEAYDAGVPSPLAEPALQYADYAVWQADRTDPDFTERQIAYWRDVLAEPLPRLEFASDRPRPAVPTRAGSMEVFALPHILVDRLKALAQREGATFYMVLLAAYKAMLFRYTGDTDIIVGGVTDTRRRPELQSMIGCFLNTVALRTRPEASLPFRQYLAQVKQSVIGALGASELPFDRLIRALDLKRGQGAHPLFNTLFSIEPPVEAFPEGWDLTQMDVVVGAAKYDLYLELDERPDGMAGRFLYSTEVFDTPAIRRMITHWTHLLEGVAADPDTMLGRLPMLDVTERHMLVETRNDTARSLPHESVVAWFASQAAMTPDAVAIDCDGECWSYADLARHSDTIAARLACKGVVPGALVGLALDRSPWMIAAMIGAAKVGAVYLPLDPGFPPARLAKIVESAKPVLVLVETDIEPALPPGSVELLRLDRDWPGRAFEASAIDGESLAYVLYTSGSTGEPKGVEIGHAALVNLLLAMQTAPGFSRGETLLAVTTLSFDIAALEIWLPLVSGGCVLLAPRRTASDMAALAELIEAKRPDVMQATPATWRGLLDSNWHGDIKMRALCGGEALPRALADRLLPRVGELWNMYGPTETTIWSTIARVGAGSGPVPIGRPIANTSVRIFDAVGNDLPPGAVGELYIGGRGLARGYRNRSDLTADRFVVHHGVRFYKTGDLARWRTDGLLECLGRTDHEEKIRGFRVAIEEVENALAALPGVSAAAVRAWPDPDGTRALAGYIVGEGRPADWRAALSKTLPDYMIPAYFIVLDTLPLTANGKIDRKALPEPRASTSHGHVPLESAQEEKLAALWRTLLKVETVSRFDDFFLLGGHSLLLARLLRQIEVDFGVKMSMAALFSTPRLADMAAAIAAGQPLQAPTLIPVQPGGDRPAILWLDPGSIFLPLIERLGRDQPFFGISVDAVLDRAGGCPGTAEQVIDLIVGAVREAQPVGPYQLGGWCTFGILAYGVAAQLRREGEDVALVVMMHASHPVKFKSFGGLRQFFSKLRFHSGEIVKRPSGKRLDYFRARLRGISDDAALALHREGAGQRGFQVDLDRVMLQYEPPVYDGAVVLFQPRDRPNILDFIDDWKTCITGDFTAHVVPGGHETMFEPPHVDHLAALFTRALDTVGVPEELRKVG